jgi:hypothetical protein
VIERSVEVYNEFDIEGEDYIRERHMPVMILMPSIFLELFFLLLESLEFNSGF